MITRAIEILQQGGVVGMPTETVYGLAARIDNPQAIELIFKTKERPFFDPLIVHISSVDQAKDLTSEFSRCAEVLAHEFWPGPLTLVLPKSAKVNPMITSGLETVGIRMPNHPLALELIQKAGIPLAAPSANKFGRTSPTCADHVREEFQKENIFVLDGGPCAVGLESTVVSIRGDERFELSMLRQGGVSQGQIEVALQRAGIHFQIVPPQSKQEAPGQMKHHYMPAIPLVLIPPSMNLESAKIEIFKKLSELPDEVEGVRLVKPSKIENFFEIQLSVNPTLAARDLYQKLRQGGQSKADVLYFRLMPEIHSSDWAAIKDRVFKAASLVLS